jgi:hypothetical protein
MLEQRQDECLNGINEWVRCWLSRLGDMFGLSEMFGLS